MFTVMWLEQSNIQDVVFLWKQLPALGRQLYSQKNSPLEVWLAVATKRV